MSGNGYGNRIFIAEDKLVGKRVWQGINEFVKWHVE